MGDATETVELVGGPLDGLAFGYVTPGSNRLALPGGRTGETTDNGDGTTTPVFAAVYYADTGRHTAAGRRAFAPAG